MAQHLLNKVAIITGSPLGIRRAISLLYAREGAKVICSDLPSARALVSDETTANTYNSIKQASGESNASRMVNNAGAGLEGCRPALCHLMEEGVWNVAMKINAKSVFLSGV